MCTHDEMMVKAAPRSALIVIESQIVFGTLEISFNADEREHTSAAAGPIAAAVQELKTAIDEMER